MTLDYERFWAIQNTRQFLYDLADQKGPIKKRELRHKIYRCLKHYPEDHWIKKVKEILAREKP